MKDFSGHYTECEKCGNKYYNRYEYVVGMFNPVLQENISSVEFGDNLHEYLLRTCHFCGYKWPEKVVTTNDGQNQYKLCDKILTLLDNIATTCEGAPKQPFYDMSCEAEYAIQLCKKLRDSL